MGIVMISTVVLLPAPETVYAVTEMLYVVCGFSPVSSMEVPVTLNVV